MESIACIDDAGKVSVGGFSGPVPWWSFSKTVLAIAALRLVERGELSLSAPIAGARYNLAHLLNHKSGLPDYGGMAAYHKDVEAGEAPWSEERLRTALDADRLRYEPGEGWAYSNIGYMKVGKLIEQAADRDLAEALEELVFRPSELTTARLAKTPQDLADVQMGEASGYHPGWVYHGLVTGTVADGARLLRLLLAGPLLRPEMLKLMVQGRPLSEHRSALYPDPAYGLGVMHWARDPFDHPIGHTGAGPGSSIAVYGVGRRTCAFWAASSMPADSVVEKTFHQLANGG